MIAQLTQSPDVVRHLVLANSPAEDGADNWEPDMVRNGWLLVTEQGSPLGVCQLTPWNSMTLEIHPTITRHHRRLRRHEAVAAMFDWIFNNTRYTKLVAIIPACYKHVKRFALEMGLRVEGNISESTLRGGKLHSQWVLGMTRSQWEARQCQA